MPVFRLPLSGNVAQTINPWNWMFNPVGSQIGLVNIELGQSSDPAVEEEVLTDVASYGKQLGQIEDALTVLIDLLPPTTKPSKEQQDALDAVTALTRRVAAIKTRHARTTAEMPRQGDRS